jgi:hypothetical protein
MTVTPQTTVRTDGPQAEGAVSLSFVLDRASWRKRLTLSVQLLSETLVL